MTVTYQGMPPSNAPFLNGDGTVNVVWYRFFQSLHSKSGLGPNNTTSQSNRIGVFSSGSRRQGVFLERGGPNVSVAYYVSTVGPGSIAYIAIYDNQTGEYVGQINFDVLFTPIVPTPAP